jgi:hypothetical protein
MSDDDEARRAKLADLLKNGLETEVTPRADDQDTLQSIIARLRALGPDDDEGRLRIAGFTDHPFAHDDLEQPCETCMYFLVHRQWCDQPELALPVAPDWSCRLWRI